MNAHPQVQTYAPVKAMRADTGEAAELLPQKFALVMPTSGDAEEMTLVDDFAGVRWLICESDLYPVKEQ